MLQRMSPVMAVCHEYRRSTRRYATVREMKEDPSRSTINRANNPCKGAGLYRGAHCRVIDSPGLFFHSVSSTMTRNFVPKNKVLIVGPPIYRNNARRQLANDPSCSAASIDSQSSPSLAAAVFPFVTQSLLGSDRRQHA